jgi:hypothetical protein
MTRTSQVKKRRRRWAIKTLKMITATKISWRTRKMKIQILVTQARRSNFR